ncbi:MAG TPA: hypothetical protein VF331_17635 [Polyangiales bacterium]
MPALKGSLTYARFFVQEALPDDFRQRFMKSIRHRAMRPLQADDEESQRSGWCAVGEPFELELDYDRVFYDGFVNLGFRTDHWAIPAQLLRAKLREAEAAYLQKKGRERLSRSEKTELKELITRKLRKSFVPVTRAVDLSWSLSENVVRFFSQSPRTTLAMTELFKKSFGSELVPEAPYTLALRLGAVAAEDKLWDELEPTVIPVQER